MQIYNSAVIAYFMICKEQIGEIRAPFSIDFICCEILLQLIIEFTSSKARTRIRNVMGAFTDAPAAASEMVHYRTYCPLTADNVVYKVKMNFNL